MTSPACSMSGGTYQGDDTACDPNPCPQPTQGACCLVAGACALETSAECAAASGSYQGDETSCDPNPCPTGAQGACCFTSGTCFVMFQGDCTMGAGEYQGDGTTCDPIPCSTPPDSGACCDAGGCRITNQSGCDGTQGFYLGNGSTCSPDPCNFGDLIGIWENTITMRLCGSDEIYYQTTLPDTICTLEDPTGGGDFPVDCTYEFDGSALIVVCQGVAQAGPCIATTTSILRETFSTGSYHAEGIARTRMSGDGCMSPDTCVQVEIDAVRTGPPPEPCNAFSLDRRVGRLIREIATEVARR